jgi:hypothetical protein
MSIKTEHGKEVFIDFRMPKMHADPVIVSRFLPDSSLKPIGRIYQNLDDETDSVTYISTDNQGEEIIPPTTDYLEAERGFENYAKQVTQKSFTEDLEAKAHEFEEREVEIKKMRQEKNRNIKIQNLNK